ncbi:hypothetical protein H4W26_002667 [Nesterenkonia halotolerans]|uniref:MarR family transcriptional regulator n=1 Tax=Nesterenkonia halotolerans TaxID=225325 RepID=A0ABR9JAE6_9MICC|nr:hypothetical protein [Nesterenkonia halotolerans]
MSRKSTSSKRKDMRLTTTPSLTPAGRRTFDAHRLALQRMTEVLTD